MPKKRILKQMEHPEAPSGFVHLYNYKEPFMPFDAGFGFQGVLLMDGKEDTVQCHFCGGWFNYLPHHIHKEHNMTATQYKTIVGLRQSSALLSETARANLIAGGLDKRMLNLKPGKRERSAEERAKTSKTLKNKPRESENEYGTCPLQIITRIREQAEKLGRAPRYKELIGRETTLKVFGSIRAAYKRAGIKCRKPGQNVNHSKANRNRPEFGVYTKDLLLGMIVDFVKNNAREPSYSDCRRGLLPSAHIYALHFGSWNKALKAASRYET